MANVREFLEKIKDARFGKDVRGSIIGAIDAVNQESEQSVSVVNATAEVANEASNTAKNASETAMNLSRRAEEVLELAEECASDAKLSKTQAAESAQSASNSAILAQNSETNANASKEAAAQSATIATTKAGEAETSAREAETYKTSCINASDTATQKASEASTYASNAKASANTANTHATTASSKATESATSANTATIKANSAASSATLSESFAKGGTGTRTGEDADNAKYYYEQAKQISQSLNGIIPKGTVTFAELPTSDMKYGYMYNISDAFTSDNRFNDGGGILYGPGNNVIWISGDKWDVLAGSSVTGIKGNKESTYRQGNVNITPEDIGALPEDGNAVSATKATQDSNGNVIVDTYRTKTGDTNTNIVSFSSGDSLNPTGWADINVVESGETHGGLFRKISLAIKNLRYLYKMIGTADISAVGDGTIKGAISGLNNGLSIHKITSNTTLIELVGQLQLYGTSKMFYASNASYFSDFPSQLSNTAPESPFITITRLNGVYVLMEIVAFNSGTGLPKTIKGVCNFETGNFGWNDVV